MYMLAAFTARCSKPASHVFVGGTSPLTGPFNLLSAMRGCPNPHAQRDNRMTGQSLTNNFNHRPEKKQLAGYGGLSSAGGAGRGSPIGDDDNEEVRQRAGSALNLIFRLRTASPKQHSARPPQKPMHLPPSYSPSPLSFSMLPTKHKHDLIDNEQLSENNDFCEACGASGFLLCCDGCDRSFHFSCLDPPLNEDASELNEPWYCFMCVAKRPVTEQSEKTQRGLFAPLLSSLKKRNPSNFALPSEIRDRFDGVHEDKNGSFLDSVHPKTR